MNLLMQFIINGIAFGALISLVALGFGLVYNTTRIFHIAHGAVYASSAYALFFLTTQHNVPVVIGVVISVILGAILGIALEYLVYQPLYKVKASPTVSMLSSFGVYIVMVNALAIAFGSDTKVILNSEQPSLHLGQVSITLFQAFSIVAYVLVAVAALLLLRYSTIGHRIKAVRDNANLYALLGLNPIMVRVIVSAIAGGLVALSACLMGLDSGIDPNMGLAIVLAATVAIIIGGIKVFEGALLGGVILGVIQNLTIWKFSAQWEMTVTFVLLMAFLLIMPRGLLDSAKRSEEV